MTLARDTLTAAFAVWPVLAAGSLLAVVGLWLDGKDLS